MRTIFAIGGGEISELETYEIDKKIVESSGKVNPKALFIPTASGEPQGYIDKFNKIYGEKLGCKIDVLLLLEGKTSSEEAKEKIMNSDIIYVGGGDTRMMIETWKNYNVDKHLREAHEKGKVLSGLSAGSICWFKFGHSDSESFGTEGKWHYIRTEGINLIDAFHCPHHNEDNREEDFAEKILEYDVVGIAIENNCAIEFKEDSYKVHKSVDDAKAYKLYKHDDEIIKEELDNTDNYNDLKELLRK